MRQHAVPLFAAASILIGVAGASLPAGAQNASGAAPSPSPGPTVKPSSKFSLKIDTYTSGTNQQFTGPGITPIEGPAFAAGSPLEPGTPYDFFSGAPQTTGEGVSQDFLITPSYRISPEFTVSTTIGYGSASGAGNVVNYWGDAIMPSINANLGSRAYSVPPKFTTHNGQDPISATRLGFLSGQISDYNGNGALTVGWLNLHQNVSWALSQTPWTNTPFQLAPQLPQSLGDGPPSVDVLKAIPPYYPLSGADLWVKDNSSTFEYTSAALPSPYNAPARLNSASLVIDHGSGLRYSGQLSALATWGPETGQNLFGGVAPSLVNNVPQSTVTGQHMIVMGLGATLPIGDSDAEVRYGYSCYAAAGAAASSGTCQSGNYFYGKLHHGFPHFDLSLEGVRFEARYAPAVLDYGTLQNIWTYPAAFPGTMPRGTYQLVDDAMVGPNRQGGRLSTTFIVGGVEVRLAFAQYAQIQAYDATDAYSAGFTEPYFLPQSPAVPGTIGTTGYEQHWQGWFHYAFPWLDVTLDLAQVNTWRSAPAGSPQDLVNMTYPMGVLTLAHNFGPKILGAAGVGRFGLDGWFDTSGSKNASLSQNVIFAGLQLRSNSTSGYGLEYRLYSVNGTPTIPGGLSPAYHGSQFQFYQRFKT